MLAKGSQTGHDGVRGHTVSFPVRAWDELSGSPDGVPTTGRISAVKFLTSGSRSVPGRAPPRTCSPQALYGAGAPPTYGPRRLRNIRAAGGDRLEASLQRVLDAVDEDPASPDPIAGYAHLYGGYSYRDRGAPGQQPWSRLHLFGPAFFTKSLYFCGPGALILDNRLANAVYRLSRLPYLVTGERPLAGMDAIPLLGLPSLDGAGGPNSGG
jgi:hypothetical protein